MSILVGDGSHPGELVEVPIMDEDAAFSGQAASNVDRAWGGSRLPRGSRSQRARWMGRTL